MSIWSIDTQYSPQIYRCRYPECDKLVDLVKKCSRCRVAIYCGIECQKNHWKTHKVSCSALGELIKSNKIGEFSQQDLEILGYTKKELGIINALCKKNRIGNPVYKETLSCYEYTLLEAGERGAREQIFTPTKDISYKIIMEERLGRWGYEVVTSPEAGDLVLYFREKELTHMGLYLKSGQVKSKPGNAAPYFIFHTVQQACDMYGSTIVYYHKNPKIEGKFNDETRAEFVYLPREKTLDGA